MVIAQVALPEDGIQTAENKVNQNMGVKVGGLVEMEATQ